jgi:hypothetical protein
VKFAEHEFTNFKHRRGELFYITNDESFSPLVRVCPRARAVSRDQADRRAGGGRSRSSFRAYFCKLLSFKWYMGGESYNMRY